MIQAILNDDSGAERTEEIARNRALVALRAPVDRLPVIDGVVVEQPVLDRTAVSHVPVVGAPVVGDGPSYGTLVPSMAGQETPRSSNRDIGHEDLHRKGLAAYQSAGDLSDGVFRTLDIVA